MKEREYTEKLRELYESAKKQGDIAVALGILDRLRDAECKAEAERCSTHDEG